LFGSEIAQVAPSQTIYLLRLDLNDLYEYEAGSPRPWRQRPLIFDVEYNAPADGRHVFLRWLSRLRGRVKQYHCHYEFRPQNVATDLPPPRSR
jgi:hypothetical protein